MGRVVVFSMCLGLVGWISGVMVPETIEKSGLLIERHYVTTRDGYVLELHRTLYSRYRDSSGRTLRPVIFLMHGLYGFSKTFTHLGTKFAMAYTLADAGNDVWMGNVRGTSPSRHHVKLNPNNPDDWFKYFDYSFDEISKYDLPAMFDYVLKYTNQKRFHYVAHAHGGFYLIMLLSLQPQYSEKIKTVHFLGCVGSLRNINPLVSTAAGFLRKLYLKGLELHIMELHPHDINGTKLKQLCTSTNTFRCMREVQYLLEAFVPEELRTQAVSLKQLAHFGQIMETQELKSWDEGASGNLQLYSSLDPITYDFNAITAPLTIYFSSRDIFTSSEDVYETKRNSSGNVRVEKITDPLFSHTDYIINNNVKHFVTKPLVKSINNYENHLSLEGLSKKDHI